MNESWRNGETGTFAAQPCDIGIGLFALRPFEEGEIVVDFGDAEPASVRTFRTLEVGVDSHVSSDLLTLVNHSCDPNLWVDAERRTLVAVRSIAPAEMLTIFYPQTEWEMSRPFDCRCGTSSCVGWITGARHLATETLQEHRLSPHIEALLANRERSRD